MNKNIFQLSQRPRRLRQQPQLREMVQENRLSASDFIMPIFIVEGKNRKEEIVSIPGQYRYSIDKALDAIAGWIPDKKESQSGVSSFILFGIPDPEKKDDQGSYALKKNAIIPQAITAIKSRFPQVLVITDLCFCEYTNHGHCGIVDNKGELDNDRTLKILGEQALVHAQAGVDMIAPSGMVDGMVGVIRRYLDTAGFTQVAIMSYSVKYASAFYGPFRDAVGSAPGFGNRYGHQMNPANAQEAFKEAELDFKEGADILMIKPGMPCLDIVQKISCRFPVPVAAYQVSGEYAMIKWASRNGSLQEKETIKESLLAFKRAGASLIISYFAAEITKELPM